MGKTIGQAAVKNISGSNPEQVLQQEKEINELIMTEDAVEMTYHMEYCRECQQGGLEGAHNLISLLGCNIYDEHEEEHTENSPDQNLSCALSM